MKFHAYRPLAALMLLTAFSAPAALADTRAVVDSTDGKVLTNTFNHCVRTQWSTDKDECKGPTPAPAPVAHKVIPAPAPHVVIEKEARTIYFDFNKAAITKESAEKLDNLATTLKSDSQVKQARIVGYADRIGTPSYNEKLSKKRAEAIREYLIGKGFIKASVADTRWFGESNPITECANTLKHSELVKCLGKDRRVELEIDYQTEEK